MANIKSQIKRNRQAKKREAHNKSVKSALKTHVKKFEEALATGGDEAGGALVKAVKAWDKAASHGAIHPNKASKQKSSMMLKYNAMLAAPAPAAATEEKPKKKAAAPKKTAAKKAPAKKTTAKKTTAKKTTRKTTSKSK